MIFDQDQDNYWNYIYSIISLYHLILLYLKIISWVSLMEIFFKFFIFKKIFQKNLIYHF